MWLGNVHVSFAFFGLAGSEAKVRDRTPYRYRNKTNMSKVRDRTPYRYRNKTNMSKARDRTPYRYRNKTTLVKYDELFIKIKKR